jgi:SET domain-containing protein
MYLIKTYLAESNIAGIGVFAAEDVSAGTVVWKYVPGFDQSITPGQFERLPPQAREFMRTYSYFNGGAHHLDGDHGRFTNHSDEPNTGLDEQKRFVARSAIRKGEEITSDYREFDANWREKLGLAITTSGEPTQSQARGVPAAAIRRA